MYANCGVRVRIHLLNTHTHTIDVQVQWNKSLLRTDGRDGQDGQADRQRQTFDSHDKFIGMCEMRIVSYKNTL